MVVVVVVVVSQTPVHTNHFVLVVLSHELLHVGDEVANKLWVSHEDVDTVLKL